MFDRTSDNGKPFKCKDERRGKTGEHDRPTRFWTKMFGRLAGAKKFGLSIT